MIPEDIAQSAERLLETCRQNGLKIATVESCTGGLVAAALTAIAGSSDVVDRGFVTYTNQAKSDLAGVPPILFETVGAVSEEVARAMAKGGVEHSLANLAVGITGVAGPGGGSDEKPVGLVHISAYREGGDGRHERNVFPGDRDAVRLASVRKALAMMQQLAET